MAWGNKAGDTPVSTGGALSFIGAEVVITGNVKAGGAMHIDGTVEGDIECGQITLGGSGSVKGNIVADRATIAGSVEGTVTAGDILAEKTARISGDLAYDNVSIENGARIDGRLTQRTTAQAGELKLVSAINE
jgi:cytoskeletal protein CcmA (bactofilin family)